MVPTLNVNKLTLLLLSLTCIFSCSKDSDLLGEYANLEDSDIIEGQIYVKDDLFALNGQESIVLDVLSNDGFPDLDKVTIVSISNANLGIVEIQEDNTILYTPVASHSTSSEESNSEETTEDTTTEEASEDSTTDEDSSTEEDSGTNEEASEESDASGEETDGNTDTFDYTAESQNEDGTTTTEEGSVTVEHGESTEEEEEETTEEETTEEETTEEEEETTEEENPAIADNARFVSVDGNSSNDGLTVGTPWSIEHAFAVAQAGETIYIKAGNYGNKNLHVRNDGTASNPIRFIGYKNNPEDTDSDDGSTMTFQDYKNNGNGLDVNQLPTVIGNNGGVGKDSGGLVIERNYVEIHNFQVARKKHGVWMTGDHNTLKNIIAVDCASEVNGRGIGIYTFESDYSEVRDCLVINAGVSGIIVQNGDHQNHYYNKVYSDKTSNPTDYYCFLTGNSERNVIRNVHVERIGQLAHTGHGLGGNQKVSYNEFYDSKIVNTSIELSYSGTNNNLFKRFHIDGNSDDYSYHYAIQIANGAHSNSFEDFNITGGNGVQFLDWDARGDTSEWLVYNAVNAGNNNNFSNGNIENCTYGIVFHSYMQLNGVAHDNTFTNVSFKNLESIFRVDRPNNGNKMINCTVDNVKRLQDVHFGNVLNFDFGNTSFSNNGFNTPN